MLLNQPPCLRLFAEFITLLVNNNGDVHIAGRRKPQQLLQVNLFGRCIQQIKAADDMINVLQVIINDHGKLIGNNPVFALHDKIAILLGQIMGNQALQFILKGNDAVIGFNA